MAITVSLDPKCSVEIVLKYKICAGWIKQPIANQSTIKLLAMQAEWTRGLGQSDADFIQALIFQIDLKYSH